MNKLLKPMAVSMAAISIILLVTPTALAATATVERESDEVNAVEWGGPLWQRQIVMWNDDFSFILIGTAIATETNAGTIEGSGLFESQAATMEGNWLIDARANPAGKICIKVTYQGSPEAGPNTFCGLWAWDGEFTLTLSKDPEVIMGAHWFLF